MCLNADINTSCAQEKRKKMFLSWDELQVDRCLIIHFDKVFIISQLSILKSKLYVLLLLYSEVDSNFVEWKEYVFHRNNMSLTKSCWCNLMLLYDCETNWWYFREKKYKVKFFHSIWRKNLIIYCFFTVYGGKILLSHNKCFQIIHFRILVSVIKIIFS